VTLMLVMIRCPDNVAPERREVHGGEFTIGRGDAAQWVIPDPERHLSKKHCRIVYSMGDWELYDLSTNGTYINRASDPIGRGVAQKLHNGDRIKFGSYELEVQIEGDDMAAPAPEPERSDFLTSRHRQTDFVRDPPQGSGAFGDVGLPDVGSSALDAPNTPILPPDFDPLAPSEEPFKGPTQPDHAPALHGAFRPPTPAAVIPDDWDVDLPGASRPQVPPAPPRAQATPAPSRSQVPPAPPPAARLPDDWDADLPQAPRPQATPAPSRPQARPAAPPAAQLPNDWDADLPGTGTPPATPAARLPEEPPARPTPPQRPAPAPAPAAPTPPPQPQPPAVDSASDVALLAAFLRGVGLSETALPDAEKVLERVGVATRATVSGLRQTLMARSSIKDEFRIAQTVIRASGNNPLKFSLDDDDALATLLGTGRRGSMPADEAIAEAFHDLRLHELATISAMQAAVRVLLEQFAPDAIERKSASSGLPLASQKKAKSWDIFVAQHKSVTQALSDDFDSVFGKAFARAYEQAIEELTKDGKPS
jgi:type VI secretion system FHA domain protein